MLLFNIPGKPAVINKQKMQEHTYIKANETVLVLHIDVLCNMIKLIIVFNMAGRPEVIYKTERKIMPTLNKMKRKTYIILLYKEKYI